MSGTFWDDNDADEITITFDDEALGEIKISNTDGDLMEGHRRLAQSITEELRPDDWDDDRAKAFEYALFQIAKQTRRMYPDFFTKDSEGRAKLRTTRQRLEQQAAVMEQFVETFEKVEFMFGHDLLWAIEFLPEKAGRRAEIEHAAQILLSPQPFPISEVVDTLARYKRFQARSLARVLQSRGYQHATDFLVRAVWLLLVRYGIDPVAHVVNEDGMTTGALVTACAMMRSDDPTRAFWVVKAAEKVRKDLGKSRPRKPKTKSADQRP